MWLVFLFFDLPLKTLKSPQKYQPKKQVITEKHKQTQKETSLPHKHQNKWLVFLFFDLPFETLISPQKVSTPKTMSSQKNTNKPKKKYRFPTNIKINSSQENHRRPSQIQDKLPSKPIYFLKKHIPNKTFIPLESVQLRHTNTQELHTGAMVSAPPRAVFKVLYKAKL